MNLDLNRKALRVFAKENNRSKCKDYFEGVIPYTSYSIKVNLEEDEIHLCDISSGFSQSIAKVFKDKVFKFSLKTKQKELDGVVLYAEEIGLSIISKKHLEKQLIKQVEKNFKKVSKI